MSELRRNRRKLREVGRRIIVGAYKRGMRGRLGIISAPTGSGKTYNIQNTIIPDDIAEGNTHFLYLTTFTDSVAQELNDFKRSLRGKAEITTSITEFLNWDYEEEQFPIVLVTTIQGAVNGGTDNENNRIIINYLKNLNFVALWDEAHFGGSSNATTRELNLKQRSSDYNASYYKFCEELAQYGLVAGFTATALFEQQGLLTGITSAASQHYHFCSSNDDWITIEELTEVTSQFRKIIPYDSTTGFVAGIKEGLNDFITYSEELQLLVELLKGYDDIYDKIKFTPKPVILINGGFASSKGYTSLPLNEVISITANYLHKIGTDPDVKIFSKVNENGFFIGSINDVLHETWEKVNTFKEFKRKLKNHNDPLQYVFHLEKFKVGLNIENITHEIHVRERSTGLDGPNMLSIEVTVSPIQLFGRAVRTWFGIDFKSTIGKDLNFVSDVVEWLINNYKDHPAFEKLQKYLLLCNSHTFYVPDSPVYKASIAQWTDENKPFAADWKHSQFHIVKVDGKLMSQPSQQERDLAYKKYRKDRCEREGCACFENFVENPPKNTTEFDLPMEKRIENYEKYLEVHHINEDRNDLRSDNLTTLCSNAHGSLSANNNSGANRYAPDGTKIK